MSRVVDVTLKLIDKFTGPLNTLGGKLTEKANEMVRMGRSIEKAGTSISNVGMTLTNRVSVPLIKVGSNAIKSAMEFEEAMSRVQGISQASGKELDLLKTKAKKMMEVTTFSAIEISDAYKYMGMAGWSAKEMMSGLEPILKLSSSTQTELAITSDIVTDGLSQFGMKASQTKDFCDALARTATTTNTDVEKMGSTFRYVGAMAGNLNYDIKDVGVAIGVMANNGIKASTSGTALRNFLKRLVSPTKQSAEAIDKLGLSMKDSKGRMLPLQKLLENLRAKTKGLTDEQKLKMASDLAGAQGMNGLVSIMKASDSEWKKTTQNIKGCTGANDKLYKVATNNTATAFKKLKNNVTLLGIEFGNMLLPYVRKLSNYLSTVTKNIKSMSDEKKKLIVKIAAVVVAIGPALLVFGKIVKTVGTVIRVIGLFGKAIKVAGSVMGVLTGPAGIVIAVVAAVAIAIALIIKNWNKLKPVFKQIGDYIAKHFGFVKDGVLDLVGAFKKTFTSIGGSVMIAVKKLKSFDKEFGVIDKIVKYVIPAIALIFKLSFTHMKNTIKSFLNIVRIVFSTVAHFISARIDSIRGTINNLIRIFKGIIKFVNGVFKGDWKQAWEGIKQVFAGIMEGLHTFLTRPLNLIVDAVNSVIKGINSIGIDIPDWVPEYGGSSFKPNIPTIPHLAKGTDYWRGGIVQISERGGEIVDLPRGSRVYPHDKSVKQAFKDGLSSSNITINIPKLADNLSIRNESDINAIAEAIATKLENVSNNLGGVALGYNY